MKKYSSLQEFVYDVCLRPSMWVSRGTFSGIYALIMGYTIGKEDTPLSGDNWFTFNRYVCIKYAFPTKYVASYVFEKSTTNDKEAIKALEETIIEFIELQKKMTSERILHYAQETFRHEEGKPEKVFRRFDNAITDGDKETIQSLIEEHKDQNILWKGKHPNDVGKLLKQISEGQPIRKIYESEDKTQVKILSADYPFLFEMNFKDGSWKIDASPLIDLWRQEK